MSEKAAMGPEGMRLLAEIGVRLGALEEAQFLLETACELRPDEPLLRIDLLLVTAPLRDQLLDADIDYDIRAMQKPSDHAPVWADFKL